MTNAAEELARLCDDFFELQNRIDPLSATLLGISGYDHLLPDYSRTSAVENARLLSEIERAVAALDQSELTALERVNAQVLDRLAWGTRADLESNIWEANAGSEGYATPPSMIFMCVPAAGATTPTAARDYLTRLSGLAQCFDTITERYAIALAEDRPSTRAGITRLVEQLRGHLATDVAEDILANPHTTDNPDDVVAQSRDIVASQIRPAIERLVELLEGPMLAAARDDEHVGFCHVPGGGASYALAVRRQTTTDLTPQEIHQIGLAHLDSLAHEWSELGERVFGISDVSSILERLRSDPSLRCRSAQQIIETVTAALDRAEAARGQWFPPFDIADCIVEEINPIEAKSAALAHYRPPAGDGSRPGAHCVSTVNPDTRFLYEYEALAFHESSPGHHLQIATAQSMTDLPAYRRFLDAQVCAFVEGWGLYSERLADQMGLYTSDVMRLGMLSFDALRACRLVVDTGMHALGWSRQQAVDFMWSHTATTAQNVANEIDRYIAWPGQALAYMIGRREIERLREEAHDALGDSFRVRDFHGVVLSNGALPLNVLASNVAAWVQDVKSQEEK